MATPVSRAKVSGSRSSILFVDFAEAPEDEAKYAGRPAKPAAGGRPRERRPGARSGSVEGRGPAAPEAPREAARRQGIRLLAPVTRPQGSPGHAADRPT